VALLAICANTATKENLISEQGEIFHWVFISSIHSCFISSFLA
jgi:hypothetical protein